MGVVFLAHDPQLGRNVAIKAIRPALLSSTSARRRFLKEAQATAQLSHDNSVTILQVGEDSRHPYIVMQLLQGETLGQRLKRAGKLEPRTVVAIGSGVASGLAAAHARGLIHRDIKPATFG